MHIFYFKIINYIDEKVESNSDIASSYVAGQTYEKRDLKVIVLKTSTSKRNIWIDCGIHAREWITPATCIWMIDSFINDYRDNKEGSLLNYYEIHILPLQKLVFGF